MKLVERSLTVDQKAIDRYAVVTDDSNPIHLDPEFAATTPMKGIIAHGTLSLNLIWQSLRATFGTACMGGVVLDIRFLRPVRPGDQVTAGGAAADDPGAWRVRVVNQNGETVIEGTARVPDAG